MRLVALGLLAAAAWAGDLTFPDRPDGRTEFVVDEAHLLGTADRTRINTVCRELLEARQVPVLVVTIPSLAARGAAGKPIELYAYLLFNEWGIGRPDRNLGMLLLVAKEDRRARIELGADWGHDYDEGAAHIMDRLIIPRFKEGEFGGGLVAGVEGLAQLARGQPLPRGRNTSRNWWILGGLLAAGVVLGVVQSRIDTARAGTVDPARRANLDRWSNVLDWLTSGGGGRGGGSYGGGSSGGGGASGSW